VTEWRHGLKPVIGLIGGIGAGKSTAAECLARRGGVVIDADSLGHLALRQPEIVRTLVDRWGESVRMADGSLDRRAIGRIVFSNPHERRALEELVFPFIGRKCLEAIATAAANPSARFVVLDAAVMLEAGWNDVADLIVYLDAPRPVRLARLAARSKWTDADLAAREEAQWAAEVKKARADAVIVNDTGLEALQEKIDTFLTNRGILPSFEKKP
jgi:dephospho-CoA kinase